ncbi:MAG TPA: hypothetical protein VIL71_10145 [Spirillospora sp.]
MNEIDVLERVTITRADRGAAFAASAVARTLIDLPAEPGGAERGTRTEALRSTAFRPMSPSEQCSSPRERTVPQEGGCFVHDDRGSEPRRTTAFSATPRSVRTRTVYVSV